ncbi:MAG: LytR/AlgR family response regulator transcription factor [Aureispira sp.]
MYTLIVDDEVRARETITQLIQLFCPQITEVAEADSVKTAVQSIQRRKPDVLLLDIHLGVGTGFDVLKQLKAKDLNVIFITAYDEYAVKAFKVSAIDYLLKPIDPDDFVEAIEKAHQKVIKDSLAARIDLFLHNISHKETAITKITLNTADSFHIVGVDTIVYCQADKNYTTFYLTDQNPILVSKNLREYEELLPSTTFIRSHQSYLVNLQHVIRYEKGEKNHLVTTNDWTVPISLRRKEQVLKALRKM